MAPTQERCPECKAGWNLTSYQRDGLHDVVCECGYTIKASAEKPKRVVPGASSPPPAPVAPANVKVIHNDEGESDPDRSR